MLSNIFAVRDTLNGYGFWYTVWMYGVSRQSLWTIFCAWQMTRYDLKVAKDCGRF
jgi:hypothetical protein